jgi:hypothetical protein
MPNYTTEALLQFMYRETSKEKSAAIEKELLTDWALKEKFEVLDAYLKGLDSLLESPRKQSVMAILDYAKASAEVV